MTLEEVMKFTYWWRSDLDQWQIIDGRKQDREKKVPQRACCGRPVGFRLHLGGFTQIFYRNI